MLFGCSNALVHAATLIIALSHDCQEFNNRGGSGGEGDWGSAPLKIAMHCMANKQAQKGRRHLLPLYFLSRGACPLSLLLFYNVYTDKAIRHLNTMCSMS